MCGVRVCQRYHCQVHCQLTLLANPPCANPPCANPPCAKLPCACRPNTQNTQKPPVNQPLTSFNDHTGNGQHSFTFSFLRPLTGVLSCIICQIVDNHQFFRIAALMVLFFQITLDCCSTYDLGKEYDCLANNGCVPREDWGSEKVRLFLLRDFIASGTELFSLLLVCFLGVTLGFTSNRFAYTDLHPTYNKDRLLWRELNKHAMHPE